MPRITPSSSPYDGESAESPDFSGPDGLLPAIAQDADTSVVYGMARKAVELHAINAIVPLEKIAGEIIQALETQSKRNRSTTCANK